MPLVDRTVAGAGVQGRLFVGGTAVVAGATVRNAMLSTEKSASLSTRWSCRSVLGLGSGRDIESACGFVRVILPPLPSGPLRMKVPVLLVFPPAAFAFGMLVLRTMPKGLAK